MSGALVVQGLPPPSELRAAVLTACSDALARPCVARDAEPQDDADGPAPTVATLYALDGDLRLVRVVVERRDAGDKWTHQRDLRFTDADPPAERWRALGLVIAALAGGVDDAEPVAESAPSGSSGRQAWLTLAALLGRGLDDTSARRGGELGLGVNVGSPSWFLGGRAGYAVRPADAQGLTVQWITLAISAGDAVDLPGTRIRLRLDGGLLVEHLQATLSAPAVAPKGSTARMSPGLQGGAEACWPAGGPVGLVAGVRLWSLSSATTIHLDGRKVASSPWWGYAATLGAQVSF